MSINCLQLPTFSILFIWLSLFLGVNFCIFSTSSQMRGKTERHWPDIFIKCNFYSKVPVLRTTINLMYHVLEKPIRLMDNSRSEEKQKNNKMFLVYSLCLS